jgi:hypothetical protein
MQVQAVVKHIDVGIEMIHILASTRRRMCRQDRPCG